MCVSSSFNPHLVVNYRFYGALVSTTQCMALPVGASKCSYSGVHSPSSSLWRWFQQRQNTWRVTAGGLASTSLDQRRLRACVGGEAAACCVVVCANTRRVQEVVGHEAAVVVLVRVRLKFSFILFFPRSLTHSLTTFSRPLPHSLTHPLTHSLTHSLITPTDSLTRSLPHCLTLFSVLLAKVVVGGGGEGYFSPPSLSAPLPGWLGSVSGVFASGNGLDGGEGRRKVSAGSRWMGGVERPSRVSCCEWLDSRLPVTRTRSIASGSAAEWLCCSTLSGANDCDGAAVRRDLIDREEKPSSLEKHQSDVHCPLRPPRLKTKTERERVS